MKTHAELLAWKRQRLIAESNVQRADLALQMQPLLHTLDSMDAGLRIVGRIRQHPEWIASLALGLALLTPRRLSSFFRSGSLGLRTWRSISPVLHMLMRRRG